MKRYTLALLISSSVALAGDHQSAKDAKSPKGPIAVPSQPAPSPLNWFVGGSGGYLTDNESGVVTGHVGFDLPWTVPGLGLGHALFLEVGWTECGDDFELVRDKKKYAKNLQRRKGRAMTAAVDTDLDIVPITLNYKLEYELASHLMLYAGAGAGIAVVDADASGGINGNDDDVVFFGQVFAGLLYELTDAFEIFAGVRGVYMDEPDLSIGGVDVGEHALETDLLIEGGGRLNF